jgi:phosphate/sulfate permease
MANDITDISILRAVSVQTTGGILLVIASVAGIPISLAEIITSGIIGFSCSNLGWKKTFANSNIVKILKFWVAGPIICILLSYLISLLMGNY